MNDKDFSKITQELGDIMIAKNLSVTTAESCTGGWVSQEITAIPGSSKWFGFGLVTYSNKAKNQVLNVAKDTLKRRGAVSIEVVEEMVSGALDLSGADIGIAISGVAGPSGGSKSTPVGTVCMAWKILGQEVISIRERFSGNREEVRIKTVNRALLGCLDLVKNL